MNTKPFFMVYVEGRKSPTHKHENLNSAETEAKRLAKMVDRKVYILCSIKSFEVNHFVVEDFRPDIGDQLDMVCE